MIQPMLYFADMPTKLILWDFVPDINKGVDALIVESDTVMLIFPVQLFKCIP